MEGDPTLGELASNIPGASKTLHRYGLILEEYHQPLRAELPRLIALWRSSKSS